MKPEAMQASAPERVAFLNALRQVVARRPDIERNKVGTPLISDWHLVWSSDEERAEAWRIARPPVPSAPSAPPYRWYFSATAVRQYLDLAGLRDDDGGPNWLRAERELGAHTAAAREAGHSDKYVVYRTGRVRVGDQPRSTRLEFYVSHTPREEGDKPQLVVVRDKGGGHRSTRGAGKPVH